MTTNTSVQPQPGGFSLKPWILAARPKTLGAAIAPVLVGSALGYRMSGQFSLGLMLLTLAACMCLQIATNFFNDALDALKGSDTHERLGPTRITASGMMSPGAVVKMAVAVLALATLLALPVIWYRGWPIVAIGIPSLYFCFGYTGGPMPLAYRGLGELFVILFFGLVAVTGSAYIQGGGWYFEALMAGLQVGALSTGLIAINNLRDVDEDTKTGKRTLAVRFGKSFGRWEIAFLYAFATLSCLYWYTVRPHALWGVLVFTVVMGLASFFLVRQIFCTEPSPAYNRYLAQAGALLVWFSIAFSGWIISP